MIKAIFFDIDGTLINFNTHTLPDSTRSALQELRNKGIKLFISSGRSPRALLDVKEVLDFDFDGYVLLNGQYCVIENQVIHQLSIPSSSIAKILPYLEENQISCEFVELDYEYVNFINNKVLELRDFLGSTAVFSPEDSSNRIFNHSTYQLCVYLDETEEEFFLQRIPDCRGVRWNPLFLDIIPKEGGKATGMSKVLKYYDLDPKDVMAFGDGGNDIEMLEFAGIGVAMGNASKIVKGKADYITDHVDSNGLRNALIHFKILIG